LIICIEQFLIQGWAERFAGYSVLDFVTGGDEISLRSAGTPGRESMNESRLVEFATRYTAAWCSHSAGDVAAFYSEAGSLSINGGTPAIGRKAVADAAQSFMTGYPNLVVKFDRLEPRGDRVLYHWRFIGTNTGPGGTGNEVRISGYEDWKIGPDGLIADSKGHYDAQDWDRQVKRR
jgi:SnoaL-like polyketide cyclase